MEKISEKKYIKIDLPINTKDAQPHKPDFRWASTTILIVIWFLLFSFLSFNLFSNFVIAKISIEKEKEIFWDFFIQKIKLEKIDEYYTFSKKIPEFEKYNIFVNDEKEANAFSFLWWNIIITKEFIKSAKYEEEILFVISHEIWHIKSRDNLRALSRDLPFKMTFIFLGIDVDFWITNLWDIATNIFSRDAEEKADIIALKILEKNWINSYCAIPFFQEISDELIGFISTHPQNKSRIENIKKTSIWKKDFSDCIEIN